MTRKPLIIGLAGALTWVALLGSSSRGQVPGGPEISPINPPVADCNSSGPADPIDTRLLTGVLPCAPNFSPPFDLDGLQHGFDFYSWLTFIALNWPAQGTIGKGPRPGGDARARWEDAENFLQLSDVMLPEGRKPAWGTHIVPAECRSIAGPDTLVAHLVEEAFDQPFRTGPLIDQNGNYALFDILINKPMFDYIVVNNLFSRQGQQRFLTGRDNGSPDAPSASPGVPTTPPLGIINFPKGSQPDGATPGTMGAIMLKASWKVLLGDEDATRFHTVGGLVYTAGKDGKPGNCVARKLGMTGFHIVHKTKDSPQWVWTTFEHVANAPDDRAVADNSTAGRRYNFYDPSCGTCPVNQVPPQPWDPQVEPFPAGFKSQVVRKFRLRQDVLAMNAAFRDLAGGKDSVWNNYMLVSTQWPTAATSTVDPTGVPAPTYLANTTLETYSQGDTPLASSSCMACHGNATTLHLPAGSSDFTYTLAKAQ
jgi:hypothetical protein